MAPTQKKNKRKYSRSTPKSKNQVSRNLKRKAQSEPNSQKRKCFKKCSYNLRGNNSVILVSETPCCTSEELSKKYSQLGLNTALFMARLPPAKRTQSHISVITISSGDEDIQLSRTAEWVASMDLDNSYPLTEEDFIGEPFAMESKTDQVHDAENIRKQMSLLQIPSGSKPALRLKNCLRTSEMCEIGKSSTEIEAMSIVNKDKDSTQVCSSEVTQLEESGFGFEPLCVSTPEGIKGQKSFICKEALSSSNLDQSMPCSFNLNNPLSGSGVNQSRDNNSLQTLGLNSPTASKTQISQGFYFGFPQISRDVWTSSENMQTSQTNKTVPSKSDFVFSGINELSRVQSTMFEISSAEEPPQSQAKHKITQELFQMPSTSNARINNQEFKLATEEKIEDRSTFEQT